MMKEIGTWWADADIRLVDVDGDVYALNGWDGESYTDCWKCSGEYNMDASLESYTLTPVYRFERDGTDISGMADDSDDWDAAVEIVDYDVRKD